MNEEKIRQSINRAIAKTSIAYVLEWAINHNSINEEMIDLLIEKYEKHTHSEEEKNKVLEQLSQSYRTREDMNTRISICKEMLAAEALIRRKE